MFRIEQKLDLNRLILHSKLRKNVIAARMHITPQSLNRLLKQDIADIPIGKLQSILTVLGYDITILIQQKEYGKYPLNDN